MNKCNHKQSSFDNPIATAYYCSQCNDFIMIGEKRINKQELSAIEKVMSYIFNMDCVVGAREHLPEKSVDLMICDPPFGIDEKSFGSMYNRDNSKVIEGYVEAPIDYYQWSRDWITEAVRCLKDDGSMYIVSGWSNSDIIGRVIREMGLFLINKIVWQFSLGVYTKRKFHTANYEIFYIKKNKSVRHKFNLDCRYSTTKDQYSDMCSVWKINRDHQVGKVRNCNKLPDALVEKMIQYSSNPGDMIGDFFLGNFTTYYSAKKLNRECCGFELNKNSFDKFYKDK